MNKLLQSTSTKKFSKSLLTQQHAAFFNSNANKFNQNNNTTPVAQEQQERSIHIKNSERSKKKRELQQKYASIAPESIDEKANGMTQKRRKEFLRFASQHRENNLKRQFGKEYEQWFTNFTELRKKNFFDWRNKVMEYRAQKRRVALHNVKQHENYMHHLGTEFARLRRERNQNRINQEAAISSYRVDQLRRLAVESKDFVAEDNVDEHIARQLDPMRVVVPTIFSNRLGVNDEVGYEVWSKIMVDYHVRAQLEHLDSDTNLERTTKEQLFNKYLNSDPLYPEAKLFTMQPGKIFEDLLSVAAAKYPVDAGNSLELQNHDDFHEANKLRSQLFTDN